jgi:pSer/pThr/pTyr-binding forkhead associated (FHA) protein
MDTQNYKRTLAGSVGAGMGALMGASGRTYFILEHKTSSKYHQAGESQKIIVDQVELGRDASCQVRFDESFETVSRKHAAIVRDGENWKLIHLSHSNPTLVNGHPINGSYYLQTGDEIQLSPIHLYNLPSCGDLVSIVLLIVKYGYPSSSPS